MPFLFRHWSGRFLFRHWSRTEIRVGGGGVNKGQIWDFARLAKTGNQLSLFGLYQKIIDDAGCILKHWVLPINYSPCL
jgi:hypothetical protein